MRRCVMQVDGNLVIYSKDNKAAWQSHTNEKRNAYIPPAKVLIRF